MHVILRLQLPSDVESVPLVRALVSGSMTELGIDLRCISDVALAVTEACANVIKHATGRGHQYEVQVEIDSLTCHIRVLDTGDGFDPAAVRTSGELAEEGRGMMLMRALTDRLDFIPRDEQRGTVVHLTKHLTASADSPLRSLAGAEADTSPEPAPGAQQRA